MVKFGVLGAVEARVDGRLVDIGHARQASVLAVLLVEANRTVSAAQLADRVWGDRLPRQAESTLYSYISRLRRMLNGADALITRRSGGYVLTVDSTVVDVHRFHDLVRTAKSAADDDHAVALLDEALGLWRDDAFAGLDSPWVNAMRSYLAGERLAAELDRDDLRLRRGKHADLVPELRRRAESHPLDERVAAQLMLAVYRSGRQADALRIFHDTRTRLAADLGVEPGQDLRRLQERILRADPGLAAPTVPTALPRPAQLPADIATFIGRAAELKRVLATWPAGLDPASPSTVVVSALDGMAGVGKTALAVHAAHRLARHFPDGQLFLDLHGYTQDVAPIEPADALDRLLRALGVAGEQVPAHIDDRAALLRTVLSGRRVLLVLDNAATEDQVRPLLPGNPGCLVLITSRHRLAGLDDATTIPVDLLPRSEAVALFGHIVGQDRVTDTPTELIADIVELCGRLPLAIRIAAARLHAHPTWTPAHLAERLRDQHRRLEELRAGQRSVTAALNLSYQHLDADQQRAYRLLGLHPGPILDSYATAAITDTSLVRAGQLLDDLQDAHLLSEPAPGTYVFHDLARAHAARSCLRHEPETDQRAALTRLFDHYTHTASAAMDLAYSYETASRPRIRRPATPRPVLTTADEGANWLDTEHANLLAIAAHAAEHGWPNHCVALSATLHLHLRVRAHYSVSYALHTRAVRLARHTGDRAGELTALADLGRIHYLQDRYAEATDCFQDALAIAREITGHRREPAALNGLGDIHRVQGRHDDAIGFYQRALAVARDIGYRLGEFYALLGIGDIHLHHDRYDVAADSVRQALAIARDLGNRIGESWALQILGNVHLTQGDIQNATDCCQQALAIARDLGNRLGELATLCSLGNIHRACNRFESATECYQRCLAIARDLGDRNGQFEALHGLGHAHHAAGDSRLALTHHQQALLLAREIDQPHDEALAHDGLARAYQALDQPDQARTHWQHALAIYTRLGLPDAAEIRNHLAELP